MGDVNKLVTICYVSMQVAIALYVSVIGAVHVRRCMAQREASTRTTSDHICTEPLPNDDQKETGNSAPVDQDTGKIEKETEATEPSKSKSITDDEVEQNESGNNAPSVATTTIAVNIQKDTEDITQKGFVTLWLKIIWKMRSVYSSLAVHCFDVLTDVLVIMQWMNTRNEPGDHVDPQAMAYSAIAVIVFSRVLSAIAIYIKERDFIRSLLQLFDLLIFQEIYESHHKIVTQLKNKQLRDKHHP
eukprot:1069290_1